MPDKPTSCVTHRYRTSTEPERNPIGFRSHFVYGDTEVEGGGGLSKGLKLDALIREEEWEVGEEI